MTDVERGRVMHWEVGFEIAEAIVTSRLTSGWSRQAMGRCVEGGPTPCGTGYYLIQSGTIAVAYFPLAQFSDANGRGCLFPLRDFFPPIHSTAHPCGGDMEPFQVGDQVIHLSRDVDGSWGCEPIVRASPWFQAAPLFTVVKVRACLGHHSNFGGRDYYQLKIKDPVRGGGGYHDLVPIAGRHWQMRGEGDCLIRVARAPVAAVAHFPVPARPAQLDLFA
jgi:hypothetical protein